MIKKVFILFSVLLIGVSIKAQKYTQTIGVKTGRVETLGQAKMDSLSFLPKYQDFPTLDIYSDTLGAIFYRILDAHFYYRDTIPGTHQWTRITKSSDLLVSNGLSKSGDTAKLGGPLIANTKVDLAQNSVQQMWFKTKLKTTSDSIPTTNVIVGDTNSIPEPVTTPAAGFTQRTAAFIISKTQQNNNQNVDLFSMVTGDAPAKNGWFFQNYTDHVGQVQPRLFTFSNANTPLRHGFTHFTYMKKGSTQPFANTAYVWGAEDYDTAFTINGFNGSAQLRGVNFVVFETGHTHYFLIDSFFNCALGNSNLEPLSKGNLEICDNNSTYGIVQNGANSVNILPSNTIIGGHYPAIGNGANLQDSGSISIAVKVSATGTLNLDGTASNWVFNGTTATWTLPIVSGKAGWMYFIKNRGSGTITLNSNAGGNDIYNTSAVNTISITAGQSARIVNDGTFWLIEGIL